MRTELFLAWRYFKPKRNAVSVITLISIIGVGLGVGVLIVVLAVMTGFTDKMKLKLMDTTAHAQIYANGGNFIKQPAEVVKAVKESGGESLPIVNTTVLIQRGDKFVPKQAIGFDPASDPGRIKLNEAGTIKYGDYSLERGQLLVSDVIATEIGLHVGEKVLLHSPTKLAKLLKKGKDGKVEMSDNAQVYLPAEFLVTGVYSFGKYDFDKNFIFMNLEDADELLGIPWGSANCVFAWVPDPFDMKPFLFKLSEKLPNYIPYSWQQLNSKLLGVLAVEKNMMFFLLVFIVLVAAFSITNTLITTVIAKTREIGLLKSMGASSFSVMNVFILQGLFVGLIGTGLGITLGFLVVHYRMAILIGLRMVTGIEIFPKEFYFFSELPADIVPFDVIWISITSVVLCTFGGVIPAFRAARLDPASALRYE